MNDHQEHHDDGKVNPFTPEVQEVKESKPDTGPQAKRVNSRLALFGVVGSVALVIFLILMQSAGSQDLKAEREQAAREEEQKRKARNRVDASQANKDAEARMAARQKELDREAREKKEAEARARAESKARANAPVSQVNQVDGQHPTTSQDDQVMVMARGIAAARGEDAQGTRQNGQKNEKDPWEEARKAFVAQDASTYYSNRLAARDAPQFFPSGAPVKPGTSGQQDATSSPRGGVPAPSGQDTPEAFAARLQAGQRQASAPQIASGTGMIQPASSGRASSVGGGSQKGTALASLNTGNAHQEAFYYQGGKAQAGYQPQVQGHGGRVDVQAGTVVHLALETGLSSELPGVVIARVTRPVYAPSMRRIAIPSGTKVIGTYNARVEKGQTRAQVIWTALVWKDGGTYDLGGLPGVDLGGQSGVEASVDEHWDKAFAGAALAGVLSASASALAGPTNQLQVDPRQQAAYGAMQPFQELGEEKAKEFMAMEPTLTLEPGALAGMLVPHDLVLSP